MERSARRGVAGRSGAAEGFLPSAASSGSVLKRHPDNRRCARWARWPGAGHVRLAAVALLSAFAVRSAGAHGFGIKPDLPIPEEWYTVGAVSAMIVTFAIVGLFIRRTASERPYRTYNLFQLAWVRTIADSRWIFVLIKAFSVFILFLTIGAGLFGSPVIAWNWTPTFIWIIWWVGFGFVHVLVGNVWAIVNPWKALYEGLCFLGLFRSKSGRGRFAYPQRLGSWPAFVLFLGFIWLELVSTDSANPRLLGGLILAYSVVTVLGMHLFGKHTWLHCCEPFSIFFHYLSMMAPTEIRMPDREACASCGLRCRHQPECVNCHECFESSGRGELHLRPFAAGLLTLQSTTVDRMAFIMLMLSSVTFDGLSRTFLWYKVFDIPLPFDPALYALSKPLMLQINSWALVGFFLFFVVVYLAFACLAKVFAGSDVSAKTIALKLIFSIVPIAIVYQIAHYALYFIVNGQLMFRLISDPFGLQWDLFGTRQMTMSYGYDPILAWNFQVGVIILGHVIGVWSAHVIALRTFGNAGVAVRSQIPMLVLMVIYTMVGLWLLSSEGV